MDWLASMGEPLRGRLRTRCRWEPVGGVGKGCGLCARMKQALYPSLRKPGRGPALDPTPGVSTRGRSTTASVTSKYTMWYHACWAIGCCMCHGPYRAATHGLAGGDAARRGTTRRFGPVRRGGAGIRHGASYQGAVRRCRKTLVGVVNSSLRPPGGPPLEAVDAVTRRRTTKITDSK